MPTEPGSAPVNLMPDTTTFLVPPGQSHTFEFSESLGRYSLGVSDQDDEILTVRLEVQWGVLALASTYVPPSDPSPITIQYFDGAAKESPDSSYAIEFQGSALHVNDALKDLTYTNRGAPYGNPEAYFDRLRIVTDDEYREDVDEIYFNIQSAGPQGHAPINFVPEVTINVISRSGYAFGNSNKGSPPQAAGYSEESQLAVLV